MAMVELALDQEKRKRFGENGYRRLMSRYKIQDMKKQYKEIYIEFSEDIGDIWLEKPFKVK